MLFTTAAKKARDEGNKTDKELKGAVGAKLESGGAETDRRGIPSDSGTRDSRLAVKRISGVHNVEQWQNKQYEERESAKIRENPEQMIRNVQLAALQV